jgi:putative solute:sodium symporter small subunit
VTTMLPETSTPAVRDPELQRRQLVAARAAHWRRTRRLTALLLALWLATGFSTVFFARDLAGLALFGWPLSFYLAAQGASLIYLAILAAYAWRMRRLDQQFARRMTEPA